MLINIDDFLLKDLEIAKLTRDASSALPAPETHNGGDAAAQAAQGSPSRKSPPCQVWSITTAETEFSMLTRDTSTAPPPLQPPEGGTTMVQTAQTSPHIDK